ncbi:hypothetical protein VIN01S_06840 [Vibrio inusitatus NBRC 102082]|uniref:DUF1840 domain-containing protein n=1 Tax=Vibrio inusitatus NBRC 102082 TaxID=1219070 RepID=A0A4Y3HT01_9VIBR|nr:DUF1840 domain-containing protein [Vibrio inusitatus]GEA49880.1 hypothetical protein VIN01S_06840 [Vibrio inusitatus NBRC 102082]
MLITFKCKAYANVILFGDIGLELLKMMGHSSTNNGAILASDVPAALNRLKAAIEIERSSPIIEEREDDNDEQAVVDQPVSLVHRALPLIELLSAAEKQACNVIWEATGDIAP